MKQTILNHLKNIYGWKTKRKIVVISVDDYGNVRLDSKKAREQMDKQGLKVMSRFDALDSLETREDLEALYEVLSSVKDKNDRHAIFTPFALPCNINFEEMAENNYQEYVYELLPGSFKKLSTLNKEAYEGAWDLWQEGVEKKLMRPQFHGREHFSLKVFNEKLKQQDHELISSLKARSNTSISKSGYSTISYTASFDFWKIEENQSFKEIIFTGIDHFETVFGYAPIHFNAPGASASSIINKFLFEKGIQFIDNPIIKNEHLGSGKYKKVVNYTGKKTKSGLININRNVVFEPCGGSRDWIGKAMSQIECAFKWGKPAIISSHRVNFCGNIEEKNRKKGLDSLKELLKNIVKKWPDVEFMSSEDLCEIINK